MELRHLRVAVALADELHFGRTAQRLRLAQSAVSQTLKALEDELSVELFARTKRTVRVTAAGARFVEGARRTLSELALASTGAKAIGAGEGGRLGVGFIPMVSLTDIPRAIAAFRRAHPAVALGLEPATSTAQLEALRSGRLDVGFIPSAAAKAELSPLACRDIATSPLVALVAMNHPLARRTWLRLADLANQSFIFLTQSGEPRINMYFRRRCIEAGFDPDVVLEVEHTDALLAFVAEGLGISCVPRWIERLGFRGVRAIPLRPAVHGGICAVWHPALLSPIGRRFLDSLTR